MKTASCRQLLGRNSCGSVADIWRYFVLDAHISVLKGVFKHAGLTPMGACCAEGLLARELALSHQPV